MGWGHELLENDGSNHGNAQIRVCLALIPPPHTHTQDQSELPLDYSEGSLKKDAVPVTFFYFILVASVISNTLSNGRWSFKNLNQGNKLLFAEDPDRDSSRAWPTSLLACWSSFS